LNTTACVRGGKRKVTLIQCEPLAVAMQLLALNLKENIKFNPVVETISY
jgi:hypothetical protein